MPCFTYLAAENLQLYRNKVHAPESISRTECWKRLHNIGIVSSIGVQNMHSTYVKCEQHFGQKMCVYNVTLVKNFRHVILRGGALQYSASKHFAVVLIMKLGIPLMRPD